MRYLYILLFSATVFSQQFQKIDFKSVVGKIEINPAKKEVSGKVIYEFDVLQMVDTIYIDAQNMKFDNVSLNNKIVNYRNSGKKLALFENYKLGKNTISFDYNANPKQAIYFNNFNANWQIWTQGQGKYTSNWFPSFDDVNEKLIFNLSVSFDKNYEVISNGILKSKTISDNIATFNYQMQKPMSSYLLMLAIGKYKNKTLKSKSGIPLQMYIEPEDYSKFEPTYRYSKQIFDFYESEIGVKYPWQIYKQIPVRDFLYAGMENTSATVFAREFVVDSIGFNDRNYIDVNAHELAHQWFGNLVTAKSGKHHWLQEGFATYYALLAEKKILGDDYFYNILFGITKEIEESKNTDSTEILNEKASSMTFYKKGAFALFVLDNEIGHYNFKKAVKNYLKKYGFKNVETTDFLNEVKNICNLDVDKFSRKWLETATFDIEKANSLLVKNKNISQLFALIKIRNISLENKRNQFYNILKSDCFYSLKEEVLFQMKSEPFDLELHKVALDNGNLKIRQIVAASLKEIPENFQLDYETLLHDKSYETNEIALVKLISNFPINKVHYLNETKNTVGNNDKSFEVLWMYSALLTIYFIEYKEEYLTKLSNYTSYNYEFSVRQNAFVYLQKLNSLKAINLENLLECCYLPNWRNAKWSKDYLKEILTNEVIKSDYLKLLPTLSIDKQAMLNRFLK